MPQAVSKSQFKPHSLEYFRKIEQTGEELVITDHGRPVLKVVPVSNAIAIESVCLPDFPHADPADRIIAATALSLGAVLVTKDDKLRNYPYLKTVW